jgi:hypothetical protein
VVSKSEGKLDSTAFANPDAGLLENPGSPEHNNS